MSWWLCGMWEVWCSNPGLTKAGTTCKWFALASTSTQVAVLAWCYVKEIDGPQPN